MTSASDPIASTGVDLIHPDGRRVPRRIWIGLPYSVDELQANCPFGIDGLAGRYLDISGNDPLQALMLGDRLVLLRLSDCVKKGRHGHRQRPFSIPPGR